MSQSLIQLHWVEFELKEGITHDDVSRWFSSRGYIYGRYATTERVHVRSMEGIGETTFKQLLAESDCPVVFPASYEVSKVRRRPSPREV